MSIAAGPLSAAKIPSAGLRTDSLAASVAILLVMTVAQRLIGFGRGVLFCRWLDPEQLGQWDVAFGFLNLMAPLAVLGLPGSFGRYAEHYRQRGQFKTFLGRTTVLSGLMGLLAVALVASARGWFSKLIFGSDAHRDLVLWIAVCLAVVIAHNFLVSLFIAVRIYRIVTALQFFQSLGFALLSIALLTLWRPGAESVIVAFALATLISGLGSLGWLKQIWRQQHDVADCVPHRAFWTKLASFAGWVWITNLLSNLFEVIDRYMIVHHSGLEVSEALRLVGNYHSSRIVPLLFVAVAGLLASMITPHLTYDWEAGRRRAVVARLNLVQKTLALALLTASIAVLLTGHLLFDVAFQGKFVGGREVLPLTLTYCSWFGLIAVAQNYLWCAERAGLGSFALLIGLLANIGLNLVLLPRFGLEGAVWSTTAANLLAIVLTYTFSQMLGWKLDRGTWIATGSLGLLAFGPLPALVGLAGITVLSVASDSIFSRREKQQFFSACLPLVGRVKRWRRRKASSGPREVLS